MKKYIFFLLTFSIFGQTAVYVDYQFGDDIMGNGSITNPYKTVKKVSGDGSATDFTMINLSSDDSLLFKAGVTFPLTTITESSKFERGFGYRAISDGVYHGTYDSAGTYSGNAVWDGQGTVPHIIRMWASYARDNLTFENLTFYNPFESKDLGTDGTADDTITTVIHIESSRNYTFNNCVIDGNENAYHCMYWNSSTNLTLSNTEFKSHKEQFGIYINGDCDTVTITDCSFDDMGATNSTSGPACIKFNALNSGRGDRTTDVVITNNSFTDFSRIIQDDNTEGMWFVNNYAYSNRDISEQRTVSGFRLGHKQIPPHDAEHFAKNGRVYNNTFVLGHPYNASDGKDDEARWIEFDEQTGLDSGGTGWQFKNNIVHFISSTQYKRPIFVKTGNEFHNVVFDYNIYHNDGSGNLLFYQNGSSYSSIGAWTSGEAQDSNSYSADPLFTTEYTNLSLQSSSTAIDSGITVYDFDSSALDEDYDYNPRPVNTYYDIGAFEYSSNIK